MSESASAAPEKTNSANRLVAVDIFRGLTIIAMIIANDPGDWGHVYAPLLHADWHGVTPTDLIFPFFLFIAGVAVALALSKRIDAGSPRSELLRKAAVRTLAIFGLGIFLGLFPSFDFSNIRIPGVLQRIAIVYFACVLLYAFAKPNIQASVAGCLLVGYCILLGVVPVPIDATIEAALETGSIERAHGTVELTEIERIGENAIQANLQPGINLQAWLDRKLVPGRLYEKAWDPEGLLSTLPAIATGILGMLVGALLTRKRSSSKQDSTQSGQLDIRQEQSFLLLLSGFGLMVAGFVWDWTFPFNKNLWSSSFVLLTGGLASMTLGSLIWLVDCRKYDRWFYIARVFGANAITAFVLHGVVWRLLVWSWDEDGSNFKSTFMNGLTTSWELDRTLVSFLWALTYTAIICVPVCIMYHRRWFVRL
ncbi:MAG: heparan-alpha-glucosaminide N-acetyltransferase domain-containing protein [Planctomycetota bacterium]